MGLGVVFVQEVAVVGAHHLGVGLLGQLQNEGVDLLLADPDIVGGVEARCGVALDLEVIVVSKNLFIPTYGGLGFVHLAAHDKLGNLATQTGRAADETLVVLGQEVFVDTWFIVETVDPGYGYEFAEVEIARLVFGQEDKVPTRAVHNHLASALGVEDLDVFVLVGILTSGTIGLNAKDGFKDSGFEFFGFQFGSLAFLGCLGLVGSSGLGLLNLTFGLTVYFVDVVVELFHAIHDAVVGEGHGVHAIFHAFVHNVGHLTHAVEDRVVGVNVKVSELNHITS